MTPVLRLRRDQDASFERVYRRHVRDVYGFALGTLGDRNDAEDITQTTFLNAYRALNRGERVENMRAWLLAIAHNVCRQRFRTAARRPQEVQLDSDVAERFTEEEAPSASEIRAAMKELAFNQRTVLVLREIEGLTYEEIADVMGLSPSAVETLLFRARRALREQLEAAARPLTCEAVERLISLQLDGKLSRQDRGPLRAHLRSCAACARLARSHRARRAVMPGLVAVPLPAGLSSGFQPVGGALAVKAAAAVAAVAVGTGTLVGTGVVPVPRVTASDPARTAAPVERIAEQAPDGARPSFATASGVLGENGASAGKRERAASAGDRAKRKKSSPTGGAAGGGLTLPPDAAAVADALEKAGDDAKSKIPAVPASPPVAAPTVPPVTVPGTAGPLP